MKGLKFTFLVVIVMVAAFSRFLPHPPNFTPILAMALFAGALVPSRVLALSVPLVALFIGDLVFGFHATMWAVYGSIGLAVVMGRWLNKPSLQGRFIAKVIGAGSGSSVLFFLLTNFAVWMQSGMYPLDISGLIQCYTLALPFFHQTLFSTMICSLSLFAVFGWISRRLPQTLPVEGTQT